MSHIGTSITVAVRARHRHWHQAAADAAYVLSVHARLIRTVMSRRVAAGQGRSPTPTGPSPLLNLPDTVGL